MFEVNEETGVITLSTGDTGEVTFRIDGYDFSDLNYRVVFSLKNHGHIVKEEYYTLDDENRFVVRFQNAVTDQMQSTKNYTYDVTIVVDPVFGSDGKITDGSFVRTLNDPTRMVVRPAVRYV